MSERSDASSATRRVGESGDEMIKKTSPSLSLGSYRGSEMRERYHTTTRHQKPPSPAPKPPQTYALSLHTN